MQVTPKVRRRRRCHQGKRAYLRTQPHSGSWIGPGKGQPAHVEQQRQHHRQQRSPPQKEERETLRPVVPSATEPVACLFPSGPRRRETLRAHLWDGGGWPHAERKPAHGASGNGGNWSIETLLRFLLFGGGPWRPVAFVAVRPPVLFPCAGGQRGCRGVAHPKILGCTPPGHGDGAGGRNRPRNFSTPRGGGPRGGAG